MTRTPKTHFQHSKQVQLTTDDGWTHVVGNGGGSQGGSSRPQKQQGQQQASDPSASGPQASSSSPPFAPAPLTSLSELAASHAREKARLWEGDPAVKSVRRAVRAAMREAGGGEQPYPSLSGLDRVLCLGLGRLARRWSADAMRQLVLLEACLDVLPPPPPPPPPPLGAAPRPACRRVAFQDPAFEPLDELFLRSRGYEVLPWRGGSSSSSGKSEGGGGAAKDDAGGSDKTPAARGPGETTETTENTENAENAEATEATEAHGEDDADGLIALLAALEVEGAGAAADGNSEDAAALLARREFMTDRTFLYCPCCENHAIRDAVRAVTPMLYLGNNIKQFDEINSHADARESERLQNWYRESIWRCPGNLYGFCADFAIAY